MKARHIPNLISLLRIGLVLPVLWAVWLRQYPQALAWFAVASLSDGVDGFIARRYGWTSRLGSHLDPMADKLLLLSVYAMLGWQGVLPAMLVAAVIARDVVIVCGGVLYWFLRHPFDGRPLRLSKLNTLLQILLALAAIYSQGVRPLPEPALAALMAAVFASTLASGLLYLWVWGRRFFREAGQPSAL
jgi:cardiolipin synthase